MKKYSLKGTYLIIYLVNQNCIKEIEYKTIIRKHNLTLERVKNAFFKVIIALLKRVCRWVTRNSTLCNKITNCKQQLIMNFSFSNEFLTKIVLGQLLKWWHKMTLSPWAWNVNMDKWFTFFMLFASRIIRIHIYFISIWIFIWNNSAYLLINKFFLFISFIHLWKNKKVVELMEYIIGKQKWR